MWIFTANCIKIQEKKKKIKKNGNGPQNIFLKIFTKFIFLQNIHDNYLGAIKKKVTNDTNVDKVRVFV